MRRVVALVLFLSILLSSLAFATDYSDLSLTELEKLRDQTYHELNLINQELAKKTQKTDTIADTTGKTTIADLFPDENFAICVRNELKKPSINSVVTQAELNTITNFHPPIQDAKDLTGISHLKNLTSLDLDECNLKTLSPEIMQLPKLHDLVLDYYHSKSLPSWITQLSGLKYITIKYSDITELPSDIDKFINLVSFRIMFCEQITEVPESLAKLTSLKTLDLRSCGITKVPDWIGNMVSLESINLFGTGITELPDSMGNLKNLQELDISFTAVSQIPESILLLNIPTFDVSHTNIK